MRRVIEPYPVGCRVLTPTTQPHQHHYRGQSVLERTYGDLGKLIARDIYDFAKKIPDTLLLLKDTALTESGSGLAKGVLEEFEETFLRAMDFSVSVGFAKWHDGKSEARFTFYLPSRLVGSVRGMSDWVRAAKRTADGVKQVSALGGDTQYQGLINDAVPQMVARAISVSRGRFRDSGNGRGWRVLSPVLTVQVAHVGKSDSAPHDLFYLAKGSEKDTAGEYKRAKKLLLGGLFRKPTSPFEGPYFD
jgi:hypothetical protein